MDAITNEEIARAEAVSSGKDLVDGRCVRCGHELRIGDFPWCPHESIYANSAQHFDPIVVHVSGDGQYRFPAATDAPVPSGYRKVEIRTIQEADRISREVNAHEDQTLRAVQSQSDTSRMATRSRNREFIDKLLAGGAWKDSEGNTRHGLSAQARERVEAAREYLAQKDQQRKNQRPRSTNFHIEVFSHDSSNREAYRDARTNWQSKRG
jgi:hypothetical protein